jgi:chromosome segregation ATPase
VHLKSLTLKGFKSFPERTRLEFGPGVSVVVGPNGSGKSNITDAVLWVLGEQSPLAVRGSSMQDVIWGGGPGVQARSAAEVEIVLDNSDRAVPLPWSEISIVRRLERSGDGEYWLGGARCRLIDVIEALSDTGLGKETHSVVSQGRIESIVTAKPRERRMLVEEAAGLGKHRARRRRAQLKLERTQLNLDRALDVEREARGSLRPLARQAKAAEVHERLERETLEVRFELARHSWLATRRELERAQACAEEARRRREELDSELGSVMARRASVERSLTEAAEERDGLADRLYRARSALERLQVRAEQVRTLADELQERTARTQQELTFNDGESGELGASAAALEGERRVLSLEEELAKLDDASQAQLLDQIASLECEQAETASERERLTAELKQARALGGPAAEHSGAERVSGSWEKTWAEVRNVILHGVRRVLSLTSPEAREKATGEVVDRAERIARSAVQHALHSAPAAPQADASSDEAVHLLERRLAEITERERRAAWLIERRRAGAEQGALAVRRAQLQGELDAERRSLERSRSERAERSAFQQSLRARHDADLALMPTTAHLTGAIENASQAVSSRLAALQARLAEDRIAGAEVAETLHTCAHEEAEIQARLRASGEEVTKAELETQRALTGATDSENELRDLARRLGVSGEDDELARSPTLPDEQLAALTLRVERLRRRRDQLGPVNPLAQEQYAEAQAHTAEIVERREDLEAALRELRSVIREADRQIRETFEATFESVARNFQEVIGDVFPEGSGNLRLVEVQRQPRPLLGDAGVGQGAQDAMSEQDASADPASSAFAGGETPDGGLTHLLDADSQSPAEQSGPLEEDLLGVEIEVTPAGKSTKRMSLLSGGEKSMAALAFLFAVFMARPCPFYVLDEVEAALDDLNLDRFLALLRRCATRAQFSS